MLCDIYNNHEVFVLPSFSEGIPMVPIEAMACGCKVVISDLDGVRNFYVSNIKNAFIKYVELPKLLNYDNPNENELTTFEQVVHCLLTIYSPSSHSSLHTPAFPTGAY